MTEVTHNDKGNGVQMSFYTSLNHTLPFPGAIPRNKTNNAVWYNDECRAASRNRRKALLKV